MAYGVSLSACVWLAQGDCDDGDVHGIAHVAI
jgi:hypothetical protein